MYPRGAIGFAASLMDFFNLGGQRSVLLAPL
jgi:hypothetical protein